VVSDAAASSRAVVRVYWSVTRASAPGLVRELSSRLNGEQVPFRLKVADHPSRLDRCDAAVLYLPHDAFEALRATLGDVACSLRLRARVPAFTLELTPGVGLAEDDGAGESFGVRRCAALADGIVRAHEQGLAEAGALDAIAERFAEDGLELDAPYREPSLAGRHVL
jgi:class II lanthipeptide synthase